MCLFFVFLTGLVTLDQMRAKQEDLVREHEKQLAAKLKSDETERLVHVPGLGTNFSTY